MERADPTLKRLAKAEFFAIGGVGIALFISQQEKDYRAILARAIAERDFETLFAVGNVPAKCYALVGLRRLNPEKFKAISSSLGQSSTEVETARGCVVSHESLATIIQRIQAGEYSH